LADQRDPCCSRDGFPRNERRDEFKRGSAKAAVCNTGITGEQCQILRQLPQAAPQARLACLGP
jgi:hypothetical protein